MGTLFVLLGMVVALQVGCNGVQQGAESDLGELAFTEQSLEAQDGNMPKRDQAPGFGSDDFLREFDSDDPADGLNDAENGEIQDNDPNGKRVFRLAILWGQLRANPDFEKWIDWSGGISGDAGVTIRPLRTIRFERGDYLVNPNVDCRETDCIPDGVQWVSRTRPHNDGVLLEVVVHPSVLTVVRTLKFKTRYYQTEVPVDRLGQLRRVDNIDRSGNKVLFLSVRRGCGRGFLSGRWKRLGRRGGVFGGRWVKLNGVLEGHLRGIWGMKADGSRVLHGVFIDRNGRFRGTLHGTYGDGHFRARWMTMDGQLKGHIYGSYFEGRAVNMSGRFKGVWFRNCPDREAPPVEPIPCDCVCQPRPDSSNDNGPNSADDGVISAPREGDCRCECPNDASGDNSTNTAPQTNGSRTDAADAGSAASDEVNR